MENNTLIVKVGNTDDDFNDVINAWEGEQLATPLKQLSFESMNGFLNCITPQRWELLTALRKHGRCCIRKLADVLSRDYKNTHTNVKMLLEAGLVEKDSDGLFFAPWNNVETHLQLKKR